MPRDISQGFRDEMNATEMSSVALVILDITHDTILPTIIRVVNNNQDIIYNANNYIATAFKFSPPVEAKEEMQPARLTISNIDRSLIETLRSITSPPVVTANVVLVSPTGTVTKEQGPWNFELSNVSYNSTTITGTLTYKFYQKQLLSTIKYNVTNFPSLVQI